MKRPIFVPIRPPTGGKNINIPSTDIGVTQSPDLLNVRFSNGQLQTRDGFSVKYQGLRTTPLSISRVFAADGTLLAIMAIDITGAYQSVGGTELFTPISLLDTAGNALTMTGLIESSYISIATGEGTYTPHDINGAAIYPTSGYAPICAFTNQEDGVVIVIPGSDGDPLIGELLSTAVGTAGARCVAFYGNRLVVGGTSDSPSEIVWSADSAFEDFAGAGSGSALLGNESERIQNMAVLGEYLVVYKEHSIYFGRLTGQTTPAIVFDKIPTGDIGLAAPLSLSSTNESHIFLGDDDVYLLNQTGLTSVGTPVASDIWGTSGSRGMLRNYVNRAFSITLPERKEYWLFTPTGKIPDTESMLTNGVLNIYVFVATMTSGSPTLTSVPDAVFDHVTVGCPLYCLVGIPDGTTVLSFNAVANTITMSANATVTSSLDTIHVNNTDSLNIPIFPDNVLTTVSGAPFGGVYYTVTVTSSITGNVGTLYSITEHGIASPVGHTISMTMYIRTGSVLPVADSFVAFISEKDAGDNNVGTPTGYYPTITADTDYVITISHTITESSCTKLAWGLQFVSTASTECSITAYGIQLVDITDVPKQYWSVTDAGYYAPGIYDYTTSANPTAIPLIADVTGSWMCDTVWVYNYQNKNWSCWALPATSASTDIQSLAVDDALISQLEGSIADITWRYDDRLLSDQAPMIVITPPDVQVHEISPKYAYDWQNIVDYPIVSYWQSKDFTVVSPDGTDLPNADKTVSRVTLFHDVSHVGVDIEVGVSVDGGLTWTRQTVPIRVGHSETFADFFVTGPQARFSVKTETPGFRITGFSLKLIQRGEVNGL